MIRNILIFLFLVVIVILIAFWPRIHRIYKVMTLFNENVIVTNFMHIDEVFPVTEMQPSDRPLKLNKDLQKIAPINGEEIEVFLKETNTSGFVILKGDTIIYEYFANGFTAKDDHISWSMSKSIVGLLIGKALEENSIESISDPVEKYVPDLKGSAYSGITIKNLLQMSSGVKFDEDYKDFNSDINKMGRMFAFGTSFKNFILKMEHEQKQGTYNKYVSMDTQVLAMVLEKATGKTLTEYCQDKLWKPMGAESKGKWITDNEGVEGAFGGLNALIYDYARVGILFNNYGILNNNRIINEQWIKDSWTMDGPHLQPGQNPLSSTPFGYGYQWWIPYADFPMYMAQGVYSQYTIVYPDEKITMVKLSGNTDFKDNKLETQQAHNSFFKAIILNLADK